MLRRRGVALRRIGAVSAVAAVTLAMAAQPAAADTALPIISENNDNQCLAIGGGLTTRGAQAIQWTCEYQSGHNQEQLWTFASHDGVTNEIRNVKTGKCLAIGLASTVRGKPVIQWDCEDSVQDPHPEQKWDISAWSNGNLKIQNHNSHLCLAIANGSQSPGAGAIQWDCTGGPEQQWG